jgi:hypothetical protein
MGHLSQITQPPTTYAVASVGGGVAGGTLSCGTVPALGHLWDTRQFSSLHGLLNPCQKDAHSSIAPRWNPAGWLPLHRGPIVTPERFPQPRGRLPARSTPYPKCVRLRGPY